MTEQARDTDYSVVVVGAGPTGIALATLLGQQGVKCLVLERYADVYPQPRAVHLDDEVFRIIDRLGVTEEFTAISRPALGLRLLSPRHRVLAEFRRGGIAPNSGHPRANMFDQPVLEGVLRNNLKTVPAATLRGNAEVFEVSAPWGGKTQVLFKDLITGKSEAVTTRFVVGCDGANSIVRKSIGSQFDDLRFNQRWLVVDIDSPADFDQWDGVHQVCSSKRAGTYMRVGATRYRWEFELLRGEQASDFTELSTLLPLIAPWVRGVDLSTLDVVRVAEYTFRAMVADRWRRGPVFIAGDAAHLTPPFIGQGMGAGLRDAQNLAWKLAGVLSDQLPPSVLDTYETERKAHATSLIKLAKLTGVVMTSGGPVGDALRRLLAPLVPLLPGLRTRVANSETPALSPNRWVSSEKSDRLAGALCPNLKVEGVAFDDICRHRTVVVSASSLSDTVRDAFKDKGATVIELNPEHPLSHWLHDGNATAAIVRPDGTVFASGPDPVALAFRLERALRA